MDDRSASAMKRSDPFAATDSMLNGSLGGESLFVINLCAANMPQAIDSSSVRAWGIPGLEVYKLYQVSRMEDGRTRYRVRLGFFTSEADAELVLHSVRGKFATAFTSGLCDEDLKHASGHLKKPLHEIQEIQDIQRTGRYRLPKFAAEDLPPDTGTTRQPVLKVTPTISRAASAMLDTQPVVAAERPAVLAAAKAASTHAPKAPKPGDEIVEFEWTPDAKPAVQKSVSQPKIDTKLAAAKHFPTSKPVGAAPAVSKAAQPNNTATKAPAGAARAAAPPPTSVTSAAQKIQLAALSQAAPAAKTPAARPNQPYHAAAGRAIPEHGLSLAEPVTAKPTQPPNQMGAAPPNLPRPLVSAAALSKLRAAAATPRNAPTVVPTLDTTQTIRTLTKTEIEDANAPKWYVVQLALSDHPANLDTMPRLDIFQAYCLYSVAVMENNIIRHALRLGFFSEHVSAEAVMGYVKTFFGEPTIERISDAEQKRFGESFALKEPPPPPPAPAKAPAGRVIAMEEKRPVAKPLGSLPPNKPARPSAQIRPNAQKSSGKYAAPAVKRSAPLAPKKNGTLRPTGKIMSKEVEEARLLGLTETAIRRVEHNPSLLSRLVDKLTK